MVLMLTIRSLPFTFIFIHLADAFIQSDLQCIQAIHFCMLPLCLFKQGVISIITSKVWSTTRICPRSSAIFNIHVALLVIFFENMRLVSIVILILLNYISQQDQMKLLNYLN